MWRSWSKSMVQIPDKSSQSSPFSCSSFKDVQELFADETPPKPTSRKASIVFHRVRFVNSLLRAWSNLPSDSQSQLRFQPESEPVLKFLDPKSTKSPQVPSRSESGPVSDKRIVVYFTSLRVVRSTFEDCKTVRSILRGFRVSIDERDLSMDSGFVAELQQILGKKELPLPTVFIGGEYIGGAEEIRQLHEIGELKKLIEGLPTADSSVCEVCGGYRFILCEDCNGSHKLFTEKSGFKTCTTCNENGLIRCHSCSSATL
ncbi:hypothetical protein IC582_026314 [Cucumis melo]|uniref:Uncharacterized protein At5g39865 n=2 Tax=Cucumis melo TaxID=3656 RepID=A0A1S3CNW4_CUCME|nr:uncharacterized protein At5g39865 [Cucumis melo]KAA0067327.1 uncharacterized protein E6C27_scaffold179G00360 [Cucumis melo var. makuwa]TYK08990.1 uncharacterized protein E5676_scaffold615G00140 [Cucumis melo var. makuwa]